MNVNVLNLLVPFLSWICGGTKVRYSRLDECVDSTDGLGANVLPFCSGRLR